MSHPVVPLTYAARRALVEQIAPRYRHASLAKKMLLLDTLVDLTGYARKYAIHLLNHVPEGKPVILRPRLPRYSLEVQQPCSWPGKRPTTSAPNASSPFCLTWLGPWSTMGTFISLRSPASPCSL